MNEKYEKMLEEMSKIANMPRSIRIVVRYDKELQKITRKPECPVIMSEGSTFVYLLMNIFMEYPNIERRYPPGTLGFSINGISPKTYTPLFDGDLIDFSASISAER
ncbi:MAG: hypothetical protein AAB781_00780 [Patescibacteria group bacterium]